MNHVSLQHGSMLRAAEEHGVSQSNASQMVRQLERRLGMPLIDWSTRPVVLHPMATASRQWIDG